MYVCHCNGLTEGRVREAARASGCRSPKAAYARLGCAVDCGRCLPTARDILRRDSTMHGVGGQLPAE